ncbi:MAG: 30S ribosomal protein S6 [Anaerolineae bacterium]|nr:30S ribosomal protein S6 [Anaerolineae bacterium]
MKRPYEIPVVFRIMPEEEFQQAIDQVVSWIENSAETDLENPGTVTKIDRNRLGRRRLAYEIKGQRDGWFVLFYATVDTRHLPEFELNLKLYDGVLRYLVVHDLPVKAKKSAKSSKEDDAKNEVAAEEASEEQQTETVAEET